MAYAAAVTTRVVPGPAGRRQWVITIAETEAAATSEWSVEGLPACGTITHYQSTITSGTGVSIAPKIGKVTGWTASTQNEVMPQLTAAAHHNRSAPQVYTLPTTAKLFGRSGVNAGTDNVILTVMVITEGQVPDHEDPSVPALAVVTMTTADTAYPVTISGTKRRVLLRLQDTSVTWRWSMTSGQVDAGTAGNVWMPMKAGESWAIDVPVIGCTIYVAADSGSQYMCVGSVG